MDYKNDRTPKYDQRQILHLVRRRTGDPYDGRSFRNTRLLADFIRTDFLVRLGMETNQGRKKKAGRT